MRSLNSEYLAGKPEAFRKEGGRAVVRMNLYIRSTSMRASFRLSRFDLALASVFGRLLASG
jgi:hypothetical protein